MNSPQQIVQADHGGKIENVIQIIRGIEQDVTFSSTSARQVLNQIRREDGLAAARSELRRYFWGPPGIEDALVDDVTVEGWSVPLWRLQGEVSATWTESKQQPIGETEDKRKIEQWVPEQRRITRPLDWLVPAHRATSSVLRALSEGIEAVNTSQKAVRVDWQGYPFATIPRRAWQQLKANLSGLPLANVQALFANATTSLSLDKEYTSAPQLPELEPEVSLLTAIDRADRQIGDYVWNWASQSSAKLTDFGHKVDVYSAEPYWFPVWVVQYSYRGARLAVVINGHNARCINALLPLSLWSGFITWSICTLVLMVPFWSFAAFYTYSAGLDFFVLVYALIPFAITGLLALVWWGQHSWLSR